MSIKLKIYLPSKYTSSCLLLVALLVFSMFLATTKKASALVGSEFIASRITDDSIFFNGNALDSVTIQNFPNQNKRGLDKKLKFVLW